MIKSKNESPEKIILRSGSIYYRYSSSTDDIQYSELRNILDNEVNHVFRSLVENVSLIQKVGYDKAAVVSALDLDGNDKVATVYLTKDTAKSLNWIEEGKFTNDETEGSKAYFVTKNVEIKQGISLDYSKTHPLTKTGLTEKVKMPSNQLNAVLWKLKILNNPNFHVPDPHGKTTFHKFTESTQTKILDNYPLPTNESEKNQRKSDLKKLAQEYEAQKNRT